MTFLVPQSPPRVDHGTGWTTLKTPPCTRYRIHLWVRTHGEVWLAESYPPSHVRKVPLYRVCVGHSPRSRSWTASQHLIQPRMAPPCRQREGSEAALVQGPQGAGQGGGWETVYALQTFPPQPLEAGAPLTSPRAKASGWAHHHPIYHHKEATS